jgi:hypothetical protein
MLSESLQKSLSGPFGKERHVRISQLILQLSSGSGRWEVGIWSHQGSGREGELMGSRVKEGEGGSTGSQHRFLKMIRER